MKECADQHDKCWYEGAHCPACKARLELDRILDDHEDIDQANITEIFKEIDAIYQLLAQHGIRAAKRRGWLPKLYARAIQNAHVPTKQISTAKLLENAPDASFSDSEQKIDSMPPIVAHAMEFDA